MTLTSCINSRQQLEGMKEAGVDVYSLFEMDENYYIRFKRFRDSTFHITSRFWDARFKEFLEIDSAIKTKEIHIKIGPLIKEEFERRAEKGLIKLIKYTENSV